MYRENPKGKKQSERRKKHPEIKRRMFRVATGISMVAMTLTLIMGRNKVNLMLLAASLILMVVIVKFSIRKECIDTGATAIAILQFLLFPISFFTAGGFYSGLPQWFVICFIYISITLEGRRKFAFYFLWMLETLVCYYVAFYYPQYVTQNTPGHYFFCSAASIILVGLLTSILLMLLNRLYEKENELSRRQKKEIEELNKAENNFFSSMSHEIRTPINTIIGLNEFILRGDIPEDVAENARNIQNASKMLLTLINDILDLSKIKSKKMEIVNRCFAMPCCCIPLSCLETAGWWWAEWGWEALPMWRKPISGRCLPIQEILTGGYCSLPMLGWRQKASGTFWMWYSSTAPLSGSISKKLPPPLPATAARVLLGCCL